MPEATGVANTLLGAMFFLMAMTYLLNNSDKDIRRYSYEVVSQTVAIFCAVLIFQSMNDIVEIGIERYHLAVVAPIVHLCHMLVWYAALQFHVYHTSLQGSLVMVTNLYQVDSIPGSPTLLHPEYSAWTELRHFCGIEVPMEKPWHPMDHVEELQSRMTCWKVLLAHIAGFAAINAFGTLQQMEPFCKSVRGACLVVVIAGVGIVYISRLFSQHRRRLVQFWKDQASLWEESTSQLYDTCLDIWEEEAEEPEDDVLSLTLSFLTVQAIRFWICGSLADKEGIDAWDVMTERSDGEISLLALVAIAFAVVTFILDIYAGTFFKDDGSDDEEPRLLVMSMATCNMAFAWCAYSCYKWFVASSYFSAVQEDRISLQVCLATFVSSGSFIIIWVLDKLADLDWTGPATDHAIIQVIGGNAILVGFAWEQCFDRAIEVIAFEDEVQSIMPETVTKVVLAAACICIIVPAWRRWILPMVLKEGWRFGFIVDPGDEMWGKVFRHNRWAWVLDRHNVKMSLGEDARIRKLKRLKGEENGGAEKKIPGYSHQKRRKAKGLRAGLHMHIVARPETPSPDEEDGRTRRKTEPACINGHGLSEPLLGNGALQDVDLEVDKLQQSMDCLRRELQALPAKEQAGSSRMRERMMALSGQLEDLAVLAADVGLLSDELPTRVPRR
eukprot:TRINITY_DN80954_c0_g1_i1.p1 TRINITY_DN80954_c0_g1~~TRINITY_DN80954_c0_g1_i1.p1  ORF type:complete len:669 (+),score=126.87 TRINITY_DN80954_c0_g1_i1:81-2087(+)